MNHFTLIPSIVTFICLPVGEEQDPLDQPFYLEFQKNGQLRLVSNSGPYFATEVPDGSPPYTLKIGARGDFHIHDSNYESMWRMRSQDEDSSSGLPASQ